MQEQETPVTTETTVRPQVAANSLQSPNSIVTVDEGVGDVPSDTPLEPPQEHTTGGSSYELSDQWHEAGLDLFAIDISELPVDRPNRTTSLFKEMIRRKFPKLCQEPTGIPPARPDDIRLRLVPSSAPPVTRPYRQSPPEHQELSQQLKTLYRNG